MWTYIPARDEKFPGGESLQDLADRMDKSIDEFIMPYVNDIIKNGGDDDKINVVIVGHGLSIWEMITARKFTRFF
jgi:broad specificity phosphatase PhoE